MGEKIDGQLGFEEESFKRVTSDNRKPEDQYFFDGDGNLIKAQTPAEQQAILEDVRNRRIKGWQDANEQLKRDHPSWGETKN